MRHLQELWAEYQPKGVVVIGVNDTDQPQVAHEFLLENSATFPTTLDTSEAAQKMTWEDYHARHCPVSYILDREGRVVDAWDEQDKGHTRARAAFEKAGMEME